MFGEIDDARLLRLRDPAQPARSAAVLRGGIWADGGFVPIIIEHRRTDVAGRLSTIDAGADRPRPRHSRAGWPCRRTATAAGPAGVLRDKIAAHDIHFTGKSQVAT